MADEKTRLIKARNAQRGTFKRQGISRKKRLEDTWRRPRGLQSKQRKLIRAKGRHPKPGFGSPRAVRGMHPSGFEEVIVFNVAGLADVDAQVQAIRISSTVGGKKRSEIQAKADEMDVKILNRKEIALPGKNSSEEKEDVEEVSDDE
ncbi:50S ribosomal protein L32e [Methanomicrobium antiquum]|uniref:Large ribosomal subunit protein eL32 n=1 Tax=Methanomicrobium antiquum TaxID=487686 RepID=A0AAF0FN63_9EURY|nr:50S ribosomal protein L32e [Methanomicrobium antiquum]MDD3977007.1 50S ribosomal protein L32e [Methanomicrobium sp.]WFN37383.1 50S ribosomal protein L32e [Methanomicrobium antiquum]